MRASRSSVQPILVEEDQAAKLLSLSVPDIQELERQGELPVKIVGSRRLIPYRSLLVFAGVAKWKFQEIVEA